MRRNAGPAGDPHAHDHEWHPEPDGVIVEDGAVIFTQRCEYTEITGSVTDYDRDETYYSEGYSCDETRQMRFDLVEMREPVENGQELVKERDEIPEKVFIELEENVVDVGGVDPEDDEFIYWIDEQTYLVFRK
jgi:hypothetical protein